MYGTNYYKPLKYIIAVVDSTHTEDSVMACNCSLVSVNKPSLNINYMANVQNIAFSVFSIQCFVKDRGSPDVSHA